MWFLSPLFIEGLVQKPSSSSDLPLIGPRPWRHTPQLVLMHVVFRFLLKIFGNAAKQACKQLQCNKTKLSEPASVNGLHNIRVYARASLLSAYTNENRGGQCQPRFPLDMLQRRHFRLQKLICDGRCRYEPAYNPADSVSWRRRVWSQRDPTCENIITVSPTRDTYLIHSSSVRITHTRPYSHRTVLFKLWCPWNVKYTINTECNRRTIKSHLELNIA